jgi:hypothetical protein
MAATNLQAAIDELFAAAVPASAGAVSFMGSVSTQTCATDCTSSDHVKYDNILYESDTGIIACDVTTTYTTTANVASLGRCQIKVAGTYEFQISHSQEFDGLAPTETAYLYAQDTTNSRSAGFLRMYIPVTDTGSDDTQISAYNDDSRGFLTFSAGQVPAWIEASFLLCTGCADVLDGYFKIEKID